MKLATYNISNSKQIKKYIERMAKDGLEYCAWRAERMLRK